MFKAMDDLDAAYDPDPLAVGDRVRVRLSGECSLLVIGHEAEFDGECGRVVGRHSDVHHLYGVQFDDQIRLRFRGSIYARTELERI